ncbi:MAG: hypothetical protein KJ587_19895 [Alphaproteobacteria bacterium]|nr:hypothetical protein [Alphaproteobacteria bacterium]
MGAKDTKKLMDGLKAEIQGMAPDNVAFGPRVTEYTRLMVQVQAETKAENSAAIADVTGKLAQGIYSLAESLGIEALVGEPVLRVMYTFTPATGDNGATVGVVLNPTRISSRVKKPKAEGEEATGNGERRDLDAIFEANANEVDLARKAEIEAEKVAGTITAKQANSRQWALKNTVANGGHYKAGGNGS